jgi:chromosome segregation ATPase
MATENSASDALKALATAADALADPIKFLEPFTALSDAMAKLEHSLCVLRPLLSEEAAIQARIEDMRQREAALGAEILAREAKLTEMDQAITAAEGRHAGINSTIEELRNRFGLPKFGAAAQA